MTKFVANGIILGALLTACAVTAAAANPMTFTPVNIINGWAINSSGEIVGYAGATSGTVHAYSYSGGALTDLNLAGLDGAPSSTGKAYGTNDSGTIVGQANNSSINSNRAFVTSGGKMTDLDAYDATLGQSVAYGVNTSGTVVGTGYYTNSQWQALVYNYSGTYNAKTGVYSGGSWSYSDVNSALGAATGAGSGGCSEALAVNGAGTVTGFATAVAGDGIAAAARPQAFVLNSAGAVTILSPPNGMDSSEGQAINAKGDVAGYTWSSSISGSNAPMLAVNNGGGYTVANLGVPAGYGTTYGYGLNDYDMVVGSAVNSTTGAYQAFLWTTGVVPFYGLSVGVNNLTTVAASALPAGWVINGARSINDSGQITGYATSSNGTSQAFILSLPQALPGDAILEGKVDINDLTIVLSHFGQTTGMNWGTGDFNDDGRVDINDLTTVLSHFGQTVGTSLGGGLAAVPEPGSLLLAVLAGLGLLAFARRRAQR